ncbi:MAG: hypothetical protein FD156_1337 [Nitrospirae bacterium]|nr:MAG: hypothetical protein FD156_1337 [Nitrospirota bacterium]
MTKKINILFFAILLYLLGGLISTFASGYLIVRYFYLSGIKWYLFDISIAFLNAIGLFITLVILLKKTSDNIKILFYRVFIAIGLVGISSLMILRFYFHMEIPHFSPKLLIASLIIDGIIIKIILDHKMQT